MTTTQTTKESAEHKGCAESKESGREGKVTRMIEKRTAEIPSATFLTLAGGAIAGSLVLKLLGRDSTANFVGQWAPTFLMLGVYNKMVKVLGSEGLSATQERSQGIQERAGGMRERSGVQAGASSGAESERPGASNERPGASSERPGISH